MVGRKNSRNGMFSCDQISIEVADFSNVMKEFYILGSKFHLHLI